MRNKRLTITIVAFTFFLGAGVVSATVPDGGCRLVESGNDIDFVQQIDHPAPVVLAAVVTLPNPGTITLECGFGNGAMSNTRLIAIALDTVN